MGTLWTKDLLRDTSDLQHFVSILQGLSAGLGVTVVTAASYTSIATDQKVLVQQASPRTVTITFPLSANYSVPILIKDENGTAAPATPINIVFTGGEKMDNLTTVSIQDPYGHITLYPQPGGGGFYEG